MIVIDNFIKDKDFLKELINKKGELFKGTYGHKLYHHDQDKTKFNSIYIKRIK